MSSRALRRLQREQEEQKQKAQLQDESESEEEAAEDYRPPSKTNNNAFDFLNAVQDGDDSEEDETVSIQKVGTDSENHDAQEESLEESVSTPAHPGRRKGKKKSKKKSKKASNAGDDRAGKLSVPRRQDDASGLDEIDLALQSLKANDKDRSQVPQQAQLSEDLKHFYQLLATDTKHLNALNEMKKLFGNVIADEDGEGAAAPARRRGRGPQQLDLGRALAGQNSPISRGQGLAGLALRRNIFMLGKEHWPKASSGGLGMELVERAWDFTTEYRFVHSTAYQDVQRQFEGCVESMDPQRVITHLQYNPYHLSTLLQVSEIAKQQGDHSVSGDLLERALFSFGRSVHSSFHAALAEGKARLDFRRPENREFWLTVWRYIGNLGQRGTWRTAYEWAKLLLSLDPEGDPYCIRLIIDQLAIKGGQSQHLIDIASIDTCTVDWGQDSPNIRISLSLAHFRLNHAAESRKLLLEAVSSHPWVFARLFQELNVGHTPKAIWGTEPRTPHETLQTETYMTRAKDLWNTPESVAFLVAVVESTESVSPPPPTTNDPITLSEARHIMLSDSPALISYLPRALTTLETSASDPLPPTDDIRSYETESAGQGSAYYGVSDNIATTQQGPEDPSDAQSLNERPSWFQSLFSRLGIRVPSPQEPIDETPELEARLRVELDQAVQDAGLDLDELRQRGAGAREMYEWMQDVERIAAVRVRSVVEALEPAARPAEPAYDDEANQRWLAGRGLLALRDFVAEHGTDERTWPSEAAADPTPAAEYAERITMLQRPASRTFLLDFTLRQGAGPEVVDLVKRLVAARGGSI